MFLFTVDPSLDITKQPKIMVHSMCILGVILVFQVCIHMQYLWGKNWLFTEIKHVLFNEISVFLMYIFLHKLLKVQVFQ